MNEDKTVLRRQLVEARNDMTAAEAKEKSERIFKRLKKTRRFRKALGVLLYSSYGNEVNTDHIIAALEQKGVDVFLPVIMGKSEFVARRNSSNTQRNAYGILEPITAEKDFDETETIDTVVCPGVGFDRTLNRLGFGEGYYDRYLSQPDVYKIGLCYDFQMVSTVFPEDHDVPMDMVVTEKRIYRRRR